MDWLDLLAVQGTLKFSPTAQFKSINSSVLIFLHTSQQIDGKIVETVTDLILGGSKITADGDFSHEMKRHLLLVRKIMTKLESILKSRDITLPTKAHLVKAGAFPIVMYGCESWTIKNAER